MNKYKGMCPRCGEVLSKFEAFGQQVEQCQKCRGMWFGADQLGAIKDGMDDDFRWKDLDLPAYAERAHFKHTSMHCPNCAAALCELYFDASHIQLEFCARCHGTWLDKGKLIRVINYLRKLQALEPIEQIEKDTLHQFVDIFVGHKGPWGEIKDFAAAWRLLTLRFAIDHPALMARLETARRALPF
jgi:Zn-finger nucleic acid-binding protein